MGKTVPSKVFSVVVISVVKAPVWGLGRKPFSSIMPVVTWPWTTVRNSVARGCVCGLFMPQGFRKATAVAMPWSTRMGKLSSCARMMRPPMPAGAAVLKSKTARCWIWSWGRSCLPAPSTVKRVFQRSLASGSARSSLARVAGLKVAAGAAAEVALTLEINEEEDIRAAFPATTLEVGSAGILDEILIDAGAEL